MLAVIFFLCNDTTAQMRIARIQPDALARGMTIAVEVLANEADTGVFGKDGVTLPDEKIIFDANNTSVIFGPVVTSWNGRVLQIPIMVSDNANFGSIPFRIKNGTVVSAPQQIKIVIPQAAISFSGSTVLGDPINGVGTLTDGNTLVVEGIELSTTDPSVRPKTTFALLDPDSTIPGNARFHPMTILSRGPIIFKNIQLSVSADSLNGGPGGGGGGAGSAHSGGGGYTGGGSDTDDFTFTNIGSGSLPIGMNGGSSTTKVKGGFGDLTDQGGGGGTGSPFGRSGLSGSNDSSHSGGYGAGSAGGELTSTNTPYGGGGGGFGTKGEKGAGFGDNGGKITGGRFLIPMQGGSAGGGGNSYQSKDSSAGSGGGGGGAMTIIGFDTVIISNTALSARGSNGTSGFNDREAGGGGGSGGGVLLSSRKKINPNNLFIDALGGKGGLGGSTIEQDAKGGAGGEGIIRVDADYDCISCDFNGVMSSGLTINIPKDALVSATGVVGGFAGVGTFLDDSIRIYYRPSHGSWKFVDTVRFVDSARFGNKNYHWEKTLPLGYDAEMYVTVMAKVASPQRRFANYEPNWLLSHLSSGIISVVPRPHLIIVNDTLDLGCIKTNDSNSAYIYLTNDGGKDVAIDSVILHNLAFTIASSPKQIAPYTKDSIKVIFTPSAIKSYKDTIVLYTSDGLQHTAILVGCGLGLDGRLEVKEQLNFGRKPVGSCDTLKIRVKSIGLDSVFIDPVTFSHPPFRIIFPTKPLRLGKDRDTTIVVEFCPTDTGLTKATFILDARRDSLVVNGTGTRKVLRVIGSLDLGKHCLGYCKDTVITVSNISNDFVQINGLRGGELLSHKDTLILDPYTSIDFTVRLCVFDELGSVTDTLAFLTDAENAPKTIVSYTGTKIDVAILGKTTLGPVCISQCDTAILIIRNNGNDSISSPSLDFINKQFTIEQLSVPTTLSPNDSVLYRITFCASTRDKLRDTMIVSIHSLECDTSYRLTYTGLGADGKLFFSSQTITFPTTDTGSCTVDSIVVSNVCGAPTTLDIPKLSAPYSVVSPTTSQVAIGTNEKVTIIYQYCPVAGVTDSTTQTLHDATNNNTAIILRGTGRVHAPIPSVAFSVPVVEKSEGIAFAYDLNVDDISSDARIDSVFFVFVYDPVVTEPIITNGRQGDWKVSGKEITPGRYEVYGSGTKLVKGALAEIRMIPHLAMRNKTLVVFAIAKVFPQATITTVPGSITALYCGTPPTNIIIPGEYELGILTPNPVNARVTIPITLGADGTLSVSITNTNGDVVYTNVLPRMKKGAQDVQLDLSSLSSGSYFISFDSWGWHETRSLRIVK